MMKLLLTVASIFFGYKIKSIDFQKMATDFIDDAIFTARKPVAMILLGIVSITFFCGGSLMAIINATRQYDLNGYVTGTATLWTGVGLATFFLVGYIWAFMVAWPGVKRHRMKMAEEELNPEPQGTVGLDEAISAFIMEFMHDRKSRKMRKEEYASKRDRSHDDEGPRGYA